MIEYYSIFLTKLSWNKEALILTDFIFKNRFYKLLLNVLHWVLIINCRSSFLKLTKLGMQTAGKNVEECKTEKEGIENRSGSNVC